MVSEDGEKGTATRRETKIERANKRKKQEEKRNGVCVCLCAHVCACVAWWARFLQFFTGGDRR